MKSLFKIYCKFIDDWMFPIAYVVHYYAQKHNIPPYGEVTIFMALAPIHFLLFVPSVLFGVVVGIPMSVYKYNYQTNLNENNGTVKTTYRGA